MSRAFLHIAFVVMLFAAACGCSRPVDASLARAESLMTEHPDSALSVLDGIVADDLDTERCAALFALLRSQALDKNYIDVADDSLISVATDYFRQSGDMYHRMLADFYAGRIACNGRDYSRAIILAMSARDIAVRRNDYYYMARAEELIADVCGLSHNDEEALKFRRMASADFERTGAYLHKLYSYIDQAVALESLSRFDESLALIDSVRADTRCDSVCSACLLTAEASALSNAGRTGEALSCYRQLEAYESVMPMSAFDRATFARCYVRDNKPDSALMMLDKALSAKFTERADSIAVLLARGELLRLTDRWRDAVAVVDSLLVLREGEVRDAFRQSAVKAQREYYAGQALAQKERVGRMWMLAAMLVAIIALLFLYYKERLRRKNAELKERAQAIEIRDEVIDRNMADIGDLLRRVEERENRVERLSDELHDSRVRSGEFQKLVEGLLGTQFATLSALCDEYFEKHDAPAPVKLSIYHRMKAEIERLSAGDTLSKLEALVNACNGDVIAHLRAEFPGFKPVDFDVLTLIVAGFSARAICLFTGLTYSNFYTKRKRLKARIAASDSTHAALYSEVIH